LEGVLWQSTKVNLNWNNFEKHLFGAAKNSFLFVFFPGFWLSLGAQETHDNYLNKLQTLDSTLETLCGVISEEKGGHECHETHRYGART
jgi:hypothetical protein